MVWSNLKGLAVMAASFPKKTMSLPTPKPQHSVVPLKASIPAINTALYTSPSRARPAIRSGELESKSPNAVFKSLPRAGQDNSGSGSYHERIFLGEDPAYVAEYMKDVIESQRVCIFRDWRHPT